MSPRPPRPDLAPGDQVLISAHRWVDAPGGRMWLPHGYRWRVVGRVTWDLWCGWQLLCEPTHPSHPSREAAADVVSVLRADPARQDRPAEPVQLGLFAVAP